jgi:ATP phosphoribosyltransferase
MGPRRARGLAVQDVRGPAGKKISTELVNITKRWFRERKHRRQCRVFLGPTARRRTIEGLVDAIVEVTETGSTIKANRLRIVHELMRTQHASARQQGGWEDTLEAPQDDRSGRCSRGRCSA